MTALELIALFGVTAALSLLMIRSAYTAGYDQGFEDGLRMEKFGLDFPEVSRGERLFKNGDG